MTFQFRPARREQAPLLIGVAGPSGAGKTASALKLARGIVGGDEGIYLVDTEGSRAKHYACAAGEEPGPFRFRFEHLDFTAPFSPDRYLEAIAAATASGARVVIVDSMSHCHEGAGGLLDAHEQELERMAGSDLNKRERVKFTAWIKPKAANGRLVNAILQMRCHMIFTLRAKDKIAIVKGRDGKTEPVQVGWTPICTDRFEYEMTTMLMLPPGAQGVPDLSLEATKIHANHRAFFPPANRSARRRARRWRRGRAGGRARQPARRPRRIPGTSAARARPWSRRSGRWRISAAGPISSAWRRGGSSAAGSRPTRWIWASCSGCVSTCSTRRGGGGGGPPDDGRRRAGEPRMSAEELWECCPIHGWRSPPANIATATRARVGAVGRGAWSPDAVLHEAKRGHAGGVAMSAGNGTRPIVELTVGEAIALIAAWLRQHAPPQPLAPSETLPAVLHREEAAPLLLHISEGTYRKREQDLDTAALYRTFRVPGESKPLVLTARIREYLDGPEAYCQRYDVPLPGRARRQRKNPRTGR